MQKRVVISGVVQGVGFRYATFREAKKYRGLKGHVRNLLDGSVEAVFEGSETAVEAMIQWCKSGPPTARVEKLEVSESKEVIPEGFVIKE